MSEGFLENEKIVDTKNAMDVEEIETIGDTITVEEKHKESLADIKTEDEVETIRDEPATEEKPVDGWIDLLGSGAILKKIIQEGTPDTKPQKNEKCTINYTCTLENGTIVDSASTFVFYLTESEVISGLDVSVGLMNLHEKCLLKIEPRLAFGKKGLPPNIPRNTTVIYDVELVQVEPEEDIELLTIHERKTIGNKKRERGNWWYMRGDNNTAIQCYRRALNYLDEVEGGLSSALADENNKPVSDADLQSLLEDRISVYNNMAAAQLKVENYDAALNSLQTVLRCQPNNLKAHFRKAKVYVGKNDLPMAMKSLQKAKELAPEDGEIQKEINLVSKLMEKQKATERELARRMFNGPKKTDGKSDKDSDKSSDGKIGLWATVGALIVVGAAGFVAYRFKYM